MHVYALCCAQRDQRRASDPLELAFKDDVSCHVDARTEPWSSAGAAITVNGPAIYPAP